MKKTLGIMGLLLCSAGMFTLPAATRNRNDHTNNQNYGYTQTYAQGHNDAYVSNARRDNDRDGTAIRTATATSRAGAIPTRATFVIAPPGARFP